MALSKTTQDHDEIRAWAEKRGGRPADVASTEKGDQVGIIRLEFPDAPNANDDNLQEIDWEPFFKKFDESGLVMVYQEVTSEGAESNFNKFVHPDSLSESAKESVSTKSAKKAPAKKTAAKSASRKTASTASAKSTGKTASKRPAAKSTGSKGYQGGRGPNKPATKAAAKKALAKQAPAKKSAAKKTASKAAAKKVAAKSTGSKGYQGGRGPNKPATKAAAKKTARR